MFLFHRSDRCNLSLRHLSPHIAFLFTSHRGSQVFEIEMPEGTFASHLDCPVPNLNTTTTKSECLALYETMTAIRRIETASDALYKSRLIRGFCHLSTGQEAIAAGMEFALTRKDAIITSYRCHGFMYTRGSAPKEIFAELMGRRDGCSKGKGARLNKVSTFERSPDLPFIC